MKKILLLFLLTGFSASVFSQTGTGWDPVRRKENFKDSVSFAAGKNVRFRGSVTIDEAIDGSTLYVKLLPDTVQVTDPTYTLPATANGKKFSFTDSFCLITVPTNATAEIPVGATINFVSYAGIMKFTPEAGAVLHSELDSVATSNSYGWAALNKIATNKWLLYGSLKD